MAGSSWAPCISCGKTNQIDGKLMSRGEFHASDVACQHCGFVQKTWVKIRERRDHAREDRLTFKERLQIGHGTTDHPKRDKLWALAWEYGHSSGYHEVESYYIEMLPLIKD